jgi:hypothetical protein
MTRVFVLLGALVGLCDGLRIAPPQRIPRGVQVNVRNGISSVRCSGDVAKSCALIDLDASEPIRVRHDSLDRHASARTLLLSETRCSSPRACR